MLNYSVKFHSNIAIVILIVCICNEAGVNAVFEFPEFHNQISDKDRQYLDRIPTEEWNLFAKMGIDSVDKVKTLEENLLRAEITVKNGSISHILLLDSLPNSMAKIDSIIAMKILKSSLYAYYTVCQKAGITEVDCESYLAEKRLPEGSTLLEECMNISQSRSDGHYQFRRLLPRFYFNGFYEMFSENKLPSPRVISMKISNDSSDNLMKDLLNENQINLALVQWAQFIEHDLSKPVVTSMSNGYSIDCCDKDNYKLLPRYRHPACMPILEEHPIYAYGRETCLNYVRSALAVDSRCTFGAMEQLNQATGFLDLSQLYGFTNEAKLRMRAFKNGYIKTSQDGELNRDLLPLLGSDEAHEFCALKLNSNRSTSCFLAGNSRVNSNPFAIVIYTIFMRNHNQIAKKLKTQHSDWNDERLFQVAKEINIEIYRRIVFKEWLPEILGTPAAAALNVESLSKFDEDITPQVSNEFAVAAIRFYYSMMPNELNNFASLSQEEFNTNSPITKNDILPDPNIFVLKDHIYKSDLIYTYRKLNDILESLLHQRPMKMDTKYVESLISDYMGRDRPTRADILAFDIQRGRDHGLQGYVKYLEICSKIKIKNWSDLEKFMTVENVNKLKTLYNNWNNIDLIIGGLSESPASGSIVGPTFTCILGEQFSKMHQWQQQIAATGMSREAKIELNNYKDTTAADILCANSDLVYVPKNIFHLSSERNPLVLCSNRLEKIRKL